MRITSLFLILLVLGLGAPATAADHHESAASDEAKIRAAALDYIEGWYEGDAERMERALHPHLAKFGDEWKIVNVLWEIRTQAD